MSISELAATAAGRAAGAPCNMKGPFLLLFLMVYLGAGAQAGVRNFNHIDWVAASTDAATPELLAQQLTAPYTSDLEKVRSIFRWITEHIAYALPRPTVQARNARYSAAQLDTLLAMRSVDDIVAYTVLKNRTAVCNGYARLFKALCNDAGIPAEIVTGFGRGGWGNPKFRSNHTWNAVYVDSAWHLLDATWASGFVTFADEFVKQYDDAYFFPDPAEFIYTHFPEDLRWSLLPNPPALHEFNGTPFKLTAFKKYSIASYQPAQGVVEAAVGDTLQFQLQLNQLAEGSLAPELASDSMLTTPVPAAVFLQPVIEGTRAVYRFPVTDDSVSWVHLVYNNDVVLRYRLRIHQP